MPEVPVTATVAAPTVAVLLAVKVNTLAPVVGLEENAAVTPVGRPDAARVMPPVKQLTAVGVMVTVPLLPSAIDNTLGDDVSVKATVATALTVRERLVVAVREPEVPVIVIVDVPIAVAQLAASVSTLLPVVGLVPKTAVTPLGSPDAARVTLPVNGLTSVTVMVSVALVPSEIDNAVAEGLSVKLPGFLATTVRAMVVETDRQPDFPVIVTVATPAVAVLLAVKVRTLLAVVGLVPKDAVTPLGRPVAVSVTPLVNPATRAAEMVSVALLP